MNPTPEEVVASVEPPMLPEVKPPTEVQVTDENKEQFFKSFLSDQPYSETFDVFTGKLKLTFKTLTVEENYDVFRQIDLDRKKERAKNEDSYLMIIVQYRLALSLVKVNGLPFEEECTKESFATDDKLGVSYVLERTRQIQKWPVHKLAALVATFHHFEAKVQKLTSEVENPDFWPAAA